MLTALELLNELQALGRSFADITRLYRKQIEMLARPSAPPKRTRQWSELYARMVARAAERQDTVAAWSPPPDSTPFSCEMTQTDGLESLLELHQDATAALDRLIGQTNDAQLLDPLRSMLMDTLDEWDTVARHLEELQAPEIEQRRVARMRTLGELLITDRGAGQSFKGRCVDASQLGLSALVDTLLPIGTHYELEFKVLGAEKPAKARGEVRWCRPRSSGNAWRIGFHLDA